MSPETHHPQHFTVVDARLTRATKGLTRYRVNRMQSKYKNKVMKKVYCSLWGWRLGKKTHVWQNNNPENQGNLHRAITLNFTNNYILSILKSNSLCVLQAELLFFVSENVIYFTFRQDQKSEIERTGFKKLLLTWQGLSSTKQTVINCRGMLCIVLHSHYHNKNC